MHVNQTRVDNMVLGMSIGDCQYIFIYVLMYTIGVYLFAPVLYEKSDTNPRQHLISNADESKDRHLLINYMTTVCVCVWVCV